MSVLSSLSGAKRKIRTQGPSSQLLTQTGSRCFGEFTSSRKRSNIRWRSRQLWKDGALGPSERYMRCPGCRVRCRRLCRRADSPASRARCDHGREGAAVWRDHRLFCGRDLDSCQLPSEGGWRHRYPRGCTYLSHAPCWRQAGPRQGRGLPGQRSGDARPVRTRRVLPPSRWRSPGPTTIQTNPAAPRAAAHWGRTNMMAGRLVRGSPSCALRSRP